MLQIVIKPEDYLRWMGALNSIEKRARLLEDDLPRICATDFSNLLVSNIVTQKYAGGYEPLHGFYANWKQLYGKLDGFWQLMGDLLKAIGPFKLGKATWMGGIPEGVMDSGGKSIRGKGDYGKPKPIAMYARVLEYGLSHPEAGEHPARPLFGPTTLEYKKKGWPIRGKQSLRRVADKWR